MLETVEHVGDHVHGWMFLLIILLNCNCGTKWKYFSFVYLLRPRDLDHTDQDKSKAPYRHIPSKVSLFQSCVLIELLGILNIGQIRTSAEVVNNLSNVQTAT